MVAAERNPGTRSARLSAAAAAAAARRDKSKPRPRRIAAAGSRSDDEDDGVHGERMKPLASCCLNTANTAVPRKPLAPLPDDNAGGCMDLLLMALESCSSDEKDTPRDSSRDDGSEGGDGAERADQQKDILDANCDDKENVSPSDQSCSRKRKPEEINNAPANNTPMPLFANAAVNVASRWLELLHLDLKGRLAALKRSRRNVRGVIVSGHIARDDYWMQMFVNMDATLAAEGSKLESNIRTIMDMQRYCVADGNFGIDKFAAHLQHPAQQQSVAPSNDSRHSRAVAACAGAICSTASFVLK